MPIDASIYSQLKPQPSPLSGVSDVLQVQGQMQQNQAQQRQFQAQKALNDSMQAALNPDGTFNQDAVTNHLISSGFGDQALKWKETMTKADEAHASLLKTQNEVEAQRNDLKGALANGVKEQGYNPGFFTQAIGKAVAGKLITPQEGQQAVTLALNNPESIKPLVDNWIGSSPKQSELASAATTAGARQLAAQTGASEAAVKIPLASAQTAEATARLPLIAAQTAKAKAEADQAAGFTAANAAADKFPDVAPGQKNEPFLASLPSGVATQVKMLAEGKLNVPAFALRTPYWQGLLQDTAKYDPSFDTVNYNSRSKTRADFTSGASAKQVNAINTVIGHLDSLSQATEALHNTDYPMVNKLANLVSKQLGRPNVTNFDTIKKAVSDEVTRVWRQSGGSEKDIEQAQQNLDAAGSPAQLHEAIATYGSLLESKLSSLNNQYKQGMGTDNVNIATPQSRATLSRLEQKAGKPAGAITGDLPAAQSDTIHVTDGKGHGGTIPRGKPIPPGYVEG